MAEMKTQNFSELMRFDFYSSEFDVDFLPMIIVVVLRHFGRRAQRRDLWTMIIDVVREIRWFFTIFFDVRRAGRQIRRGELFDGRRAVLENETF
mgnify:CR=1 FL=1